MILCGMCNHPFASLPYFDIAMFMRSDLPPTEKLCDHTYTAYTYLDIRSNIQAEDA